MSQTLLEPSPAELRLSALIRERVVREIERRDDPATVAEELDLAEVGLQTLLWRSEWPLDQAIRVAEALRLIDERMVEALVAERS